jgi:predicted transcriptional regulator
MSKNRNEWAYEEVLTVSLLNQRGTDYCLEELKKENLLDFQNEHFFVTKKAKEIYASLDKKYTQSFNGIGRASFDDLIKYIKNNDHNISAYYNPKEGGNVSPKLQVNNHKSTNIDDDILLLTKAEGEVSAETIIQDSSLDVHEANLKLLKLSDKGFIKRIPNTQKAFYYLTKQGEDSVAALESEKSFEFSSTGFIS